MLVGWLQSGLNRKLAIALMLVLVIASAGFLVLFVTLYRSALTSERTEASVQLNRLLQVALENAMLKRDLAGLEDIVARLGGQPGIRRVMIANSSGEVRFADHRSQLGRQLTPADVGCTGCRAVTELAEPVQLPSGEDGGRSLRSVTPIRNREACVECHGPATASPVNGLLIVDLDSSGIEHDAMRGAGLLTGAGGLVLLASVMATGWFVRRHVVKPLGELNEVSRRLASDNTVRAPAGAPDEIGQLAQSFNAMADSIGATMSELEDSKALLQGIIDTLPDGLRIIDQDYTVVLVNQAYCDQTGTRALDAGRPCYHVHGRTTPCPPTLFSCPLVELAESAGPIKYAHRHRRPDGSEVDAELMAAAVDVTHRGAKRRLVIESFRDLGPQIRYSQEQRLAEIGQLATGVAHEIRNPLSSVKLGLRAMLSGLDAGRGEPDRLRSYLQLVDGEVEKCLEVTSNLLRLGMPPSGHVQLLSLAGIAREVLSLLQYEAETQSVTIATDVPAEGLRTLAKDSDLRMLILNLAQNALHAMPGGGSLRVCGREDDASVTIVIEDTGVGIDPAVLPRIFDPFFSKRADGEAGTGLGLTICKAIVTRYHGTIDVSSAVGKGTTFTISLPRAQGGDEP